MKEEDFDTEDGMKHFEENLNEEELEFFHNLATEMFPEDKEELEDSDLGIE